MLTETDNSININFSNKKSPSQRLLYEFSDLNSSANSILFTSSSNATNMKSMKLIQKNEGPIKLNESFIKNKYSSSVDSKNFKNDLKDESFNKTSINTFNKKENNMINKGNSQI